MRRRYTITLLEDTQRNRVVVRGWKGGDLARSIGAWPTYSGTVHGWIMEPKHLPDLVALLEHRHIRCVVVPWSDAA